MNHNRFLMVLAAVSLVVLTVPAIAADTSGDGSVLPDICKSAATTDSKPKMKMDQWPMDPAHQDLMAGMDQMNKNMNEGMMAKNIDVAFVCGMIPHHQGAIDMAKAELAHGADPWAKAFAQKVIDAQTQEISDMKAWLAK